MIAQTSAVNTEAESGNLMEITVFDGKTVAQATISSNLWDRYKLTFRMISVSCRNDKVVQLCFE